MSETLTCVPFVVDENPYAVWEWNLRDRNLDFLRGIDQDFYTYVVDAHAEHLDDERHSLRSAMAIRLTYAQSLETFFALLGALVQAPQAVYAWLLRYRNFQLRNLTRKLSEGEPVLNRLAVPPTLDNISRGVHEHLDYEESKKEWIIEGFARAWKRFASDFLDEKAISEYNSAKHGMRTRLGGFSLAIGREEVPGERAPPEAMQSLGGSKHGTSFYEVEALSENNVNFRGRRVSRNWIPENMINGVHLLSMSIGNVVSKLRILNGDAPEECIFHNPDRPEAFQTPWSKSPGPVHINMDANIDPDQIEPKEKAEILDSYPD